MGNISQQLGRARPDGEIVERIGGRKDLAESYKRFETHLAANGVDLAKTRATLGPMLTMDPSTERFTGDLSRQANALASPKYRKPFIVPEKV